MENVLMRRFLWILMLLGFLPGVSVAAAEEGVFVLDPGHGGYDIGIVDKDVKEKDITLVLAREMKKILLTMDIDAELTRKIDHYQSISDRRSVANRMTPKLFLSIHLSDGDRFTVYTAWYGKPFSELDIREYYTIESRQRKYVYKSEDLARSIAGTLEEQFQGARIYKRKMPLPLISSIGAPSVLIEVPSTISSDRELFRVASSIVLGMLRYAERNGK